MSIKNSFSIKDLENLSGIKAHTIRIWEKRYGLFDPNRTETNIRRYDLATLQKLLNISLLINKGFKVSEVAVLNKEDLQIKVQESYNSCNSELKAINDFKLSMMSFNQCLFEKTYTSLLENFSITEIFKNYFFKLLEEIGILWTTDTITPAHEHFIHSLIEQKLLVNIENLSKIPIHNSEKVYVLFLPLNEIHELGLLFIHYKLLSNGYHSIYLGPSVPTNNLHSIQAIYNDITFISSLTIEPKTEELPFFIQEFYDDILINTTHEFLITGSKTHHLKTLSLPSSIKLIDDVNALIENLENTIKA